MIVGTVDLITRHCFAAGILASAKHLSGKRINPRGSEKGILTSCNVSSLVIDKLCDQARRQSTAVVCFYLDSASQEEQSPADILGSLLKQLVNGLDNIPEEVLGIFRDERMGVGGRALQFAQIAKLFRTIISSQRTIICIDALSECGVKDRLKLLNELREILQKSPGTRLFLTGKPDIRSEIETLLEGAVTVVSITRRPRLSSMTESNLGLNLQQTTPDLPTSSSLLPNIHPWDIGSPQPIPVGSCDINLRLAQNAG